MRVFYFVTLLLIAAHVGTQAQNSAQWEVWNNTDGLSKLSNHSTDSVTFEQVGNVATLRCEN